MVRTVGNLTSAPRDLQAPRLLSEILAGDGEPLVGGPYVQIRDTIADLHDSAWGPGLIENRRPRTTPVLGP